CTATRTTATYTLSLHDALPIFAKIQHQSCAFLRSDQQQRPRSHADLQRTLADNLAIGVHRHRFGRADRGGSDFEASGALQPWNRSEEHTSELQSQSNLVCRLLL